MSTTWEASQQHVYAAITRCQMAVRAALLAASPRDFDGSPNAGVTEQTFKMMWLTALRTLFPEVRVQSERVVAHDKRIDLLLSYNNHVEVIELKYIRGGFLECVSFTSNHREMAEELRLACSHAEDVADWTRIRYCIKYKKSRVVTVKTVEYDATVGKVQATQYVGYLVGSDATALPPDPKRAVGYTVIVGVARRVEVFAQALVVVPLASSPVTVASALTLVASTSGTGARDISTAVSSSESSTDSGATTGETGGMPKPLSVATDMTSMVSDVINAVGRLELEGEEEGEGDATAASSASDDGGADDVSISDM